VRVGQEDFVEHPRTARIHAGTKGHAHLGFSARQQYHIFAGMDRAGAEQSHLGLLDHPIGCEGSGGDAGKFKNGEGRGVHGRG
jgi:hypothetical protein